MSAIPRFKRRCLDLDGNTKLKSKAGHSGNDSSIISNAVQFADRKFQAEKVNECLGLFSSLGGLVIMPSESHGVLEGPVKQDKTVGIFALAQGEHYLRPAVVVVVASVEQGQERAYPTHTAV